MNETQLTRVKPSQRQLDWQKKEFYGFIHFGMNTMTDREWGLGNEDPKLFDPKKLDCEQWVRGMKAAGMTGGILTCKHHDGFCLWPSKFTQHSVASSPWKDGKGDVVKEFSEACYKYGLKFGVYLSPWDRTEATYGTGQSYDDFFVGQLEELLTNYGSVFEVWFDGANGEDANGKKQKYDWKRYYKIIRKLQPNAVIAVCGPDVRWVGNEAGVARTNEWSVVPKILQDIEKIAESSQQVDDGKFSRKVSSEDDDLGSRKVLANYTGELIWYPAEVNTSIRPGWFYHKNEDEQVRTEDELFDLYCNSVGGNSTFLLNVPPTPEGLFADQDKTILAKLGEKISSLYKDNLIDSAQINYSSKEDKTIFQSSNYSWKPSTTDSHPWISLRWDQPVTVNMIILQENISDSQRIEKCAISAKINDEMEEIISVESVGYKKIIRFEDVRTTEIKIEFLEFREYPTIENISIIDYKI